MSGHIPGMKWLSYLFALSFLCNEPLSAADNDSVVGSPALGSGELLQHPQLVAVSAVDDRLLRYRLVGADSLGDARLDEGGRLFFHLRADSTRTARALMQRVDAAASLVSMPPDIGQLPVPQKKAFFFSILLPIVQFHNETVLARRQRLVSLSKGGSDPSFLQAMAEYYALDRSVTELSTRADSLRELLRRVDVLPPSLVLAQGAIESGWGTSRFAREGNNLYGQRVWRSDLQGMAATGVQTSRFRLAVYSSIAASVRSYMRNLNTHPSYEELRGLRADARARKERIGGQVLAEGLMSYSTRGEEYVVDVQRLIRSNALEQFDAEVP